MAKRFSKRRVELGPAGAAPWVGEQLGQYVDAAKREMVTPRRAKVDEEEQVRRFVEGGERWRVEAGLVSPGEFAEYQREMLRKLGYL